MSPVRHISSARPIDLTRPDQRPLVEAGYEDVGAQWLIIEKFFEKLQRRPDKTAH